MQKLVDNNRIAGGVLVVARRGKVVQFETCGMMRRFCPAVSIVRRPLGNQRSAQYKPQYFGL